MGKILLKFKLPAVMVRVLVKDRIRYPGRLFVDTTNMLGRCGVLLLLYWYVFRLKAGVINGATFIVVAWSIFFYFSFLLLQLRSLAREMMKDVRSGNVELMLVKPISYIWYRVWWQIGTGMYSFIIVTLLALIILVPVLGIPQTMSSGLFLFTFIPTFLFGIILCLLIYSIVGLLSFWIQDINPVCWIIDKFIMILGGSWFPVALFPPFLYKISTWSPFGASYFITRTMYDSWQNEWLYFLSIQLFWIVLFSFTLYFLFRKVRTMVSVNGG